MAHQVVKNTRACLQHKPQTGFHKTWNKPAATKLETT